MQILSVFLHVVMYLSEVTSVARLMGFSADLPMGNITTFMQNTYNTTISANPVLLLERRLVVIDRTER